MIRMKQVDGLSCPSIDCDHCRGEITNPEAANALWTFERPDRIYHVHKLCTHTFEHQRPQESFLAEELGFHLIFLLNNCGLKGKTRTIIERDIQKWRDFGLVG
jgi:hypothetical protein